MERERERQRERETERERDRGSATGCCCCCLKNDLPAYNRQHNARVWLYEAVFHR
ncbi:hypothetical protein ACF0H5_010198 [Mactra antiquata]